MVEKSAAENQNQLWIVHEKLNHIEQTYTTIMNRIDELERRVLLMEYDNHRTIIGKLKRGS